LNESDEVATKQMRRKQEPATGLVTSAVLGGVATALVVLFSDLTGARLPWAVATMVGALIGSVLGYVVWRVK